MAHWVCGKPRHKASPFAQHCRGEHPMQDPLPAVTEAEASGETAAIFADFRAVLGVSTVNLIWRHLATIPGALPWAWGALRPAYADGRLATAAAALRVPPLPLPAIPPAAWAAAGLDAPARAAIAAIETAYARTNPLAMLALTALAAPPPGAMPQAAPAPPAAASGMAPEALALPPLPASLPPTVMAQVARLNGFGAQPVAGAPPLLASMYRHLGPWPAYLDLAAAQLAPAAADGRLAAAIEACRAEAARTAQGLGLSPGPCPAPAAVATAIARFGGEVLPRMVVICEALRASLPRR